MLTLLGRRAQSWALRTSPWTHVYGLARTLLALGTLSTLAFNDASVLFRLPAGGSLATTCTGLAGWSLFCLLSAHLEAARWIAAAALLVIASGWRPRLTCLPHWWIAFSLTTSSAVIDGGDHVTTTLALLLLPVALTDARRTHWDPPAGRPRVYARLVALTGLAAIRVQVAIIYLDAFLSKLAVPEWTDGTAVYYWFTHPEVGMVGWLQALAWPVLTHPLGVLALTWGALGLELFLSAGLVMDRRWRGPLLAAALLFHAGIAVVHALPSFALAMWAALILYLRPSGRTFALAAYGLRTPRRGPADSLDGVRASPAVGV